jgi:ADP-heptose:LPS heptosyltransferase
VPRSDLNFEVDDMLNMLRLFGHSPQFPKVYNLPGEAKSMERPYVLYFTGASVEYKCWPDDNFTELLKSMATQFTEYDHLVLKGKADWESIDEVMDPLKAYSNVMSATADNVEEIISIVKGSKLVISNDTSVRNIGIAATIPTVGIFFATPPYRYCPKEEKHKAVFNEDASVPGVDKVFSAVKGVLR